MRETSTLERNPVSTPKKEVVSDYVALIFIPLVWTSAFLVLATLFAIHKEAYGAAFCAFIAFVLNFLAGMMVSYLCGLTNKIEIPPSKGD